MTTHLVSILGLPRRDASGDHRYATVTYRFPDRTEKTTTTFGLALADWFQTRPQAPLAFDNILWLGTTQSAWASLLQTVSGNDAVEAPVFLELFDAVEATQDQLDRLAVALSEATGKRHQCRLIPHCKNADEQANFVTLLTGEFQEKDRLVLDLTHGLRNQSLMLAQSALMLEGAFGVRIEGLFYGGLEIPRKEGEPAPAVDLTGLLIQARLAQALAAFRQSGDVRVLVGHLPEGGFRTQLENLGHAVAVHDYTQARNLATSALAEMAHAGIGVLEPALRHALETFKARSLAGSQFQQVEAHLDRKDYLRAVLELYEGAITAVCQQHQLNAGDAQDRVQQATNIMRQQGSNDWKALEFLRNQMAHGVATDWHGLMQTSKNPAQLEKLLRQLLIAIPRLAQQA
jgi:CRISPR-associated Csx2 family protein